MSQVVKNYIAETNLIEEWDFLKNTLDPEMISLKSNRRVWWIGKNCKHSWDTIVSRRGGDSDGCPICSNRRLLKGFNDFATRYPEHAQHWSSENLIKPDSFIRNDSQKYYWDCEAQPHEYLMSTKHKIRGQSCPYCNNKKILKGFNDFASNFHKLSQEWDYSKNLQKPDEILCYSFTKVYWLCRTCGNSWGTSLINRTKRGTGCATCSNNGISLEEKSMTEFICNILSELDSSTQILENDRKILKGKELDVYIPDLRLAFEYNGEHWHDRERYEKDVMDNTSFSPEMKKLLKVESLEETLIHIWSSDWMKRRIETEAYIKEIVTSRFLEISKTE